jgi:hypothetical protein
MRGVYTIVQSGIVYRLDVIAGRLPQSVSLGAQVERQQGLQK